MKCCVPCVLSIFQGGVVDPTRDIGWLRSAMAGASGSTDGTAENNFEVWQGNMRQLQEREFVELQDAYRVMEMRANENAEAVLHASLL